MNWQPIETAPKDLNSILVFSPEIGIAMAFWNKSYGDESTDEHWKICFSSYRLKNAPPTHWMPLPQKPTIEACDIHRTAEKHVMTMIDRMIADTT